MFRSRVHEWYEEAAREVERDLSLDIHTLEKVRVIFDGFSVKISGIFDNLSFLLYVL